MKKTIHFLLLLASVAAGAQERNPLTVKVYPQASLSRNVGQRQFSGLTYLGQNLYAAVDDKLPGGGIVYLQIDLDDYGRVRMGIPEATAQSAISGRDNEGIAFVPGTQRLWVTSEADQCIREYGLDGLETGRSLRVPAAFGVSNITPNMGFEALTFNAVTGSFWTTTEGPLKGESTQRLLAFTADCEVAGTWLYQMESPQKSAASASAYVFGIPAIAAMDDGRVLVLEREVYVPNGGILEKAFRSFTRMHLFVVDPAAVALGELLAKESVASWTTSALNLANFEGMCLGPELSDGSRALLLIADSQGGSGGLTSEYIKLITIK